MSGMTDETKFTIRLLLVVLVIGFIGLLIVTNHTGSTNQLEEKISGIIDKAITKAYARGYCNGVTTTLDDLSLGCESCPAKALAKAAKNVEEECTRLQTKADSK